MGEVVQPMMSPGYYYPVGGGYTLNCFSGDSFVETTTGRKKMRELQIGDDVTTLLDAVVRFTVFRWSTEGIYPWKYWVGVLRLTHSAPLSWARSPPPSTSHTYSCNSSKRNRKTCVMQLERSLTITFFGLWTILRRTRIMIPFGNIQRWCAGHWISSQCTYPINKWSEFQPSYTRVLSWMHRLPEEEADFVQLRTENGFSLLLTPQHFIYRVAISSSYSFLNCQ